MAPTFKQYLSPSDRARIERERADIRARRQATQNIQGDGGYFRPPEVDIDDSHLIARDKELQGVLERETPPTLDPIRKNAAYREFNSLLKKWEDNAMTKYEQGLGYHEIMKRSDSSHATDYENTKKKAMAWEFADEGQYVAGRLKELAGVLDPHNPELRNLENFRRRK